MERKTKVRLISESDGLGKCQIEREKKLKKHHVLRRIEILTKQGGRDRGRTPPPVRSAPAGVALNIVVFVYRAYNSHAKGTVYSNKARARERERAQKQFKKGGEELNNRTLSH